MSYEQNHALACILRKKPFKSKQKISYYEGIKQMVKVSNDLGEIVNQKEDPWRILQNTKYYLYKMGTTEHIYPVIELE